MQRFTSSFLIRSLLAACAGSLFWACSPPEPEQRAADVGAKDVSPVLRLQLSWETSRSAANEGATAELPPNVATIQAILRDANGRIVRDIDGQLVNFSASIGNEYLWLRRLPVADNLTLEVQGLDNESHPIYQTTAAVSTRSTEQSISLSNANPLALTMSRADTIAPFDVKLTVADDAQLLSDGTVVVQFEARDNWGVRYYWIRNSPQKPRQDDINGRVEPENTPRSVREQRTVQVGAHGGAPLPDRSLPTPLHQSETLYAWALDEEGNMSPAASVVVSLKQEDSQGPANVTLRTSWGATRTSNANLLLDLSATDNFGVAGFALTETSEMPALDSDAWTLLDAPETAWAISNYDNFTLSEPRDTTVYLWVRDEAGNVSPSSETFAFDQDDVTAPFVEQIVVNNGAATLTSRFVKVDALAVDDRELSDFVLTESGVTPSEDANWQPFPTALRQQPLTAHTTLTGNTRQQTVFLWVRDGEKNYQRKQLEVTYAPEPSFVAAITDHAGITADTTSESDSNEVPTSIRRLHLRLGTEPAAPVQAEVVLSDPTEAVLLSSSNGGFSDYGATQQLTFTASNWDQTQTVYFRGRADSDNADQTYQIFLDFTLSGDCDPSLHDCAYARLGRHIVGTLTNLDD